MLEHANCRLLVLGNGDKPNVRQTTELKGHTASIEKVAFNPVKELELCSVSSDGVVRFWDVKTKQVLNEVKGLGNTFTLAWAPHGECVVVGNKVRIPDLFLSLFPLNTYCARTINYLLSRQPRALQFRHISSLCRRTTLRSAGVGRGYSPLLETGKRGSSPSRILNRPMNLVTRKDQTLNSS